MISEQLSDLIENVTIGALASLMIGTTMIDASNPAVIGVAMAAFGAIGTAVKILWARNTAQERKNDMAFLRCEEEHVKTSLKVDQLVETVIELSGSVGTLKGWIQGFQEATKKTDLDHRAEK
jgi:hypothetical protein